MGRKRKEKRRGRRGKVERRKKGGKGSVEYWAGNVRAGKRRYEVSGVEEREKEKEEEEEEEGEKGMKG